MEKRIIRLPQLMNKIGFKKTKIYQLIKEGELKPVKLGIRAIGFLEAEVDAYIQQKIDASRPINTENGDNNA
ncbi:MAG: AlpA family transcriptional regulator [Rickettsiales bacterium]|nr:AlpA family transcriptional regulator [Rickettsiales bacterium]